MVVGSISVDVAAAVVVARCGSSSAEASGGRGSSRCCGSIMDSSGSSVPS